MSLLIDNNIKRNKIMEEMYNLLDCEESVYQMVDDEVVLNSEDYENASSVDKVLENLV